MFKNFKTMPGQSEYDAVDIEKQVGQVKQSQTKTQNDHVKL